MTFDPVEEGFVHRTDTADEGQVAVGPRLVLTDAGDVVCSYMVQSAIGINDFVPMLARSLDDGETWATEGPVWPELTNIQSIYCSVSRGPSGDLFLFGKRWDIDAPGESFWSEETEGLKQNELIWARSVDGGRTWTEPVVIPMPIPGSAEAPGPMCVTRSDRWLAPYSPYNTFDPDLVVDRNQVVVLTSDDRGRTWDHDAMMRFDDEASTAAEAWVVELSDGRLLGACWHLNPTDDPDYPNAYALSLDGGDTWTPTRSTGIKGQSTSLTPLPHGRALFIYNQRQHGEFGVWIAVVRPTRTDFGVQQNEIAWRAEAKTRSGTSGEHSEWTDFSFGEPHALLLPDDTALLVLWCAQPSGTGIRYVKLRSS